MSSVLWMLGEMRSVGSWGFSKSTLRATVESVGIEYVHVPQLGNDSILRKKVATENDFKRLLSEYRI